jgi:hypothetical protein
VSIARDGSPKIFTSCGGSVWRHPFRARVLDEDELGMELAAAGFEFVRRLDDRGAWVEAKLA